MSLTFWDLSALSRAVAAEHAGEVDVLAVTWSANGSERVEVVMSLRDDPDDRRIMVNVPRTRDGFERELRTKLRAALELAAH
jgi:hypothetical protein